MGDVTKLSSKFQISVPKSVREQQNWKVGQKFAFVPRGKSVVLVPIPTLEDLLGSMPDADPTNYRDREDRY